MFKRKNKKESDTIIDEIYKKFNTLRYLYLLVGLFLISVSFNMFLLPNNIVFGGVSGLSIIFKKLFGIDTSLFILISSLLLLIVSFIVIDKEKTKVFRSILNKRKFNIHVEYKKRKKEFNCLCYHQAIV